MVLMLLIFMLPVGTSITSMATIEPLIGSNIWKWIADIKFLLRLDLEMCLIGDAPAPLTDASTDAEKVYLFGPKLTF
jgi:hypothetical protein